MGRVGSINAVMNLKTDSVTSGLDQVKRQSKAAMSEMRKEVNESNHSLALMGEAFGVTVPRHIRGFVSELPGVARAMSVAFDGLAIIVVIEVLAEAGKKVKELAEAYQQAGEKSARMWGEMGKVLSPLQESNDALQVTKDKLQASIDKLEHKPHNGIKDAIDEAILAADQLNKRLNSAAESVAKTLREQSTGTLKAMLTMGSTNRDVETNWNAKNRQYETETDTHRTNLRALDPKDKDGLKLENDRFLFAITGVHTEYLAELTREYNASTDDKRKSMLGFAKDSDNEQFEGAKNEIDVAGLTGKKDKLTQAQELERQQAQVAMAAHEATIADWEAQNGKSVSQEAMFWLNFLDKAKKGSQEYKDIAQKITAVKREMGAERHELQGELNKTLAKTGEDFKPALPKEDEKGLEDITKKTEEWLKAVGDGVKGQQSMKLALDEANIKYLEQTGQLSKNDAAMQLAQLKAKAYSDEIKSWQEKLAAIASATYLRPDEKRLYTQQANNQIAGLQGQVSTEGLKAKGDLDSQSAIAGMHQYWTSAINDANDAAAQVKSLMTQATNSLNGELVKGMMGKKMDWGKAFNGLASSTLTSGLKQGEGMLVKGLKLGESPIHPMYVSDVNGVGGATGGAAAGGGGFLSGFLHTLHIPGYAAGGDPTAGLRIVGEKGPEVEFGGSSHVTNNSDLNKMLKGGGGTTIHIGNVDARGSNAADVEMRMHRVAQMYSTQSAQSTIKAQREMAARRPRSS